MLSTLALSYLSVSLIIHFPLMSFLFYTIYFCLAFFNLSNSILSILFFIQITHPASFFHLIFTRLLTFNSNSLLWFPVPLFSVIFISTFHLIHSFSPIFASNSLTVSLYFTFQGDCNGWQNSHLGAQGAREAPLCTLRFTLPSTFWSTCKLY
jgi:hypothetical protein